MEAKLPLNPFIIKNNQKDFMHQELMFTAYNWGQKDMLKFFVDFLDEHIELCKERKWDVALLEALKINFKSRFVEDKNESIRR